MKSQLSSLSVFLPCYNEEANLEKTVKNVVENVGKVASKWELIIVNDGSTDKTEEIGQALSKKNSHIRLVTHSVNRGYGASFKSGMYNAKYDWISFIDGDGQFDFSEIVNFVATQEKTKADLVVGYYRKRQVSFIRKLNSFAWQSLLFLLFGLKIRDVDCAFKLVSRKVIDTISPLESERGAFISSEFMIKAIKSHFKIVEIPVTHYPRRQGMATGANINVILRSFIDLFRLWKKLR